MKILTLQNKIRWHHAFLIGCPWGLVVLSEQVSNNPMVFTLRRFIDDPGIISFVTSINILFNFMVGVFAAYLSDRIWTRFGRRKPFIVTAWFSAAVIIFFIPIVGSFWLLFAAIVCYQFFIDFGRPWDAFYLEVVPQKQRGRAAIFRMMLTNLSVLFFSTILIGQLDHTYQTDTPFGPLNGEHVIYWSTAAILLVSGLFIAAFTKETVPFDSETGKALSYHKTAVRGVLFRDGERLGDIFANIFASKQQLWTYALFICPVISFQIFGPNFFLMSIEQLEMRTSDMKVVNLWVMPFTIFVFTPIAGYLCDRISRMLMLRIGLIVPSIVGLVYIATLRYTNFEWTYGLLIGFGIATAVFQTWMWVPWAPLIADYTPINKLGTYSSGTTFCLGILGFISVNLGGQWVKLWTYLFGNPGKGTYDYSSIYILGMIMSVVALGITYLFSGAEKRGEVQALGKMEAEAKEAQAEQ